MDAYAVLYNLVPEYGLIYIQALKINYLFKKQNQ